MGYIHADTSYCIQHNSDTQRKNHDHVQYNIGTYVHQVPTREKEGKKGDALESISALERIIKKKKGKKRDQHQRPIYSHPPQKV